ncbi:DUF3153 domain-containing protein [Allosaccharopolyspora coralli]|uniref:DUF3153 domain-containing protein n=1 Tax=Allosaccharopolyspora coralli TaxID=2665642 RepID=A0A5Q3QN05_9PSEU|nr:DUF3153 domain-containing protein [Allosaccharopolyspora coralli]
MAAAVLVIVLAGVLTSGCLDARTTMTITENDLVSGEIVAVTPTPVDARGFQLAVPDGFEDKVRSEPYRDGDRSGSRLSFEELTFTELEQLAESMSNDDSRYRLELSRTGSLVNLDGEVDLTPLADTDSTVTIEVSAPGDVTTTDGQESAGLITWEPEVGEVTPITATFQYSGSQDQSWIGWTLLLGGGTFLVAAAVGVMALLAHARQQREIPQRA